MKWGLQVLLVFGAMFAGIEAAQACRGPGCSYIEWHGGNCGEFTPSGSLIRWVSTDAYSVVNLATMEGWTRANATHSCGGA